MERNQPLSMICEVQLIVLYSVVNTHRFFMKWVLKFCTVSSTILLLEQKDFLSFLKTLQLGFFASQPHNRSIFIVFIHKSSIIPSRYQSKAAVNITHRRQLLLQNKGLFPPRARHSTLFCKCDYSACNAFG